MVLRVIKYEKYIQLDSRNISNIGMLEASMYTDRIIDAFFKQL